MGRSMLRPYEGLLHICPYGNPSTDDQFLLATHLADLHEARTTVEAVGNRDTVSDHQTVLAFLLTRVAGVVLAAIFIRQFVTRQFDDHVLEQQRASFVDEVKTYYEMHGSLTHIECAMPRRMFRVIGSRDLNAVRAMTITTLSAWR